MHAAIIIYGLCKMSHFAADHDEVSSGLIRTPETSRELPFLGLGLVLPFICSQAFGSVPETVPNCVSRSPLPREPNYAACQTELHKMSGGKESVCHGDDADDARVMQRVL